MLSGVLNLAKPSGITSRRVVDVVDRLVRPAKCGHAGTLDPLAEGVLVVCVGSATRLIEYVQRLPKSYRGSFRLGATSPTEDTDGEVTLLENPPVPTREQLIAAAARLVGRIEQRPPAFSAKKLAGRRAYDLARRGEEVQLAATTVEVYRLDVVAYDYPTLTLDVDCGSGTYIRSLGRDLARSLGTDAVMSALTRTAIGPFTLPAACPLAELTAETLAAQLLPPAAAVRALPSLTITSEEARRLIQGQPIGRPEIDMPATTHELAALDSNGNLVAIVERRGNDYWPTRVLGNTAAGP